MQGEHISEIFGEKKTQNLFSRYYIHKQHYDTVFDGA